MRIGVAAAGYGDGYPRHAPAGTPVRVNGAAAQVVGRVSMDLMTIDLRGLPDARAGDPVVLWGAGLLIESVSEASGYIAYELSCPVTRSVQFVDGYERPLWLRPSRWRHLRPKCDPASNMMQPCRSLTPLNKL